MNWHTTNAWFDHQVGAVSKILWDVLVQNLFKTFPKTVLEMDPTKEGYPRRISLVG
jgi:hypothetical protein